MLVYQEYKWEYNIKMELKAIEWDGGYWIQLFQDIEK
jgi:hypothetical protein